MSEIIDINDPSLVNELVEVDGGSGEDFFSAPLPHDGDHLVRLELGANGITVGQQSAESGGRKFLNVHLAETLYDDAGNPVGKVFDRVNSVIMERNGRRTSRLHAILDLIDAGVGTNINIPDFGTAVTNALAQSPAIIAVVQWQASAKAETDEEVEAAVAAKYAKAGKLKVGWYYTFAKGEKRFPALPDGGFDPEIENPITGEKVRAQAVVIRYKRA